MDPQAAQGGARFPNARAFATGQLAREHPAVSIACRLATLPGGRIEPVTLPGDGSVFTRVLPPTD